MEWSRDWELHFHFRFASVRPVGSLPLYNKLFSCHCRNIGATRTRLLTRRNCVYVVDLTHRSQSAWLGAVSVTLWLGDVDLPSQHLQRDGPMFLASGMFRRSLFFLTVCQIFQKKCRTANENHSVNYAEVSSRSSLFSRMRSECNYQTTSGIRRTNEERMK